MHSTRHLDWEHTFNTRDLGGLPTADGGETRRQALVRSDMVARLNERGQAQLLAYGVRTILDLRAPREVELAPLPFSHATHGAHTPAYVNISLDKFQPEVFLLLKQAKSNAEIYTIILDRYPDTVTAALRAIADAEPGGVLIHCHAGKDRTGIIAALVLALAKVPRDVIAQDYALTQERLWGHWENMLETDGETEENRWLKPVTPPETIDAMFAHLDTTYGGVREYLLQAGMTDDALERVARRIKGNGEGCQSKKAKIEN